MLIANATGCSSIFGGNLPTTPWTVDAEGRGPAWANSLFEDNAEFGLGLRLGVDQHVDRARALVRELAPIIGEGLAAAILDANQQDEVGLLEQRTRISLLKDVLGSCPDPRAAVLFEIADYLVRKSVWIVGGDGWAYDIGYGGLDHVLASGADVNVLVLDSEVYSNTGGQASKATPRGAVARFASAGKRTAKKDLALLAMTYGHVYVAHVAFGANDTQTVRAFLEAESYRGPSLIIGYAHCIAHGIDIANGLSQQRKAVASGHWPLFRFDPRQGTDGRFPLMLDSKGPAIPFTDYAYEETRYRSLKAIDPEAAARLAVEAEHDIQARWKLYETLAGK
jgi:pyruvate-ferredoxin/flavodoxin oxidoreductase